MSATSAAQATTVTANIATSCPAGGETVFYGTAALLAGGGAYNTSGTVTGNGVTCIAAVPSTIKLMAAPALAAGSDVSLTLGDPAVPLQTLAGTGRGNYSGYNITARWMAILLPDGRLLQYSAFSSTYSGVFGASVAFIALSNPPGSYSLSGSQYVNALGGNWQLYTNSNAACQPGSNFNTNCAPTGASINYVMGY